MTSLNILLLDDDRGAVDALAMTLSQRAPQARCQPFYSGQEALSAALSQPPDVIIVSLEMPGMSGNEFARAVRRAFPQRSFPVLIAVSEKIMALANARRERAFDHFLHKPLDVSALSELLVSKRTIS
ncbi:response regulator [Variovorax sp. HJSM1_2]|uniref:response regulator n=1 Tax=Variovorax sp. HJSM1_2 TaxID=3366263 RepID=UPI003BE958AC